MPFLPPSAPAPVTDRGPRRPRLLVRAARAGLAHWRRELDLPRLLMTGLLPPPGAALARLEAEEERLDEARRARAADYGLERHLAVLIALLAERAALAAFREGRAAS
ncbi:hypothetical protein GI374_06610 [Paracoccus sp. S-4012]|nr:hypothetical protein [Paracoccus sp. S-4012]